MLVWWPAAETDCEGAEMGLKRLLRNKTLLTILPAGVALAVYVSLRTVSSHAAGEATGRRPWGWGTLARPCQPPAPWSSFFSSTTGGFSMR